MKKMLCIILSAILAVTFFVGCTPQNAEVKNELSVVTTIFPAYDFARAVAGDKANISMLIQPGTEVHSYEPSPSDIIKIQKCDVFVYIGGESESWVKGILDSFDSSKIRLVKLIDVVEPVLEEATEGMEVDEDEEDEEYDEHIWTSPKNAIKMLETVKNALIKTDAKNSSDYEKNFSSYRDKIAKIDKEFEKIVNDSARNTIVFGDRFPFRYFADEFGLKYFAAFPGCSSESEPGAKTIAFLIDKVKSEKIPVVFYVEFSNEKTADTLCEATGAKKLLLHSCHNVTKTDFAAGVTYVSLMEQNVKNLQEALK